MFVVDSKTLDVQPYPAKSSRPSALKSARNLTRSDLLSDFKANRLKLNLLGLNRMDD